jgi:4-amino-4-deoxy-L-arabinose transferase-like glycosyltransferase
MQTPINSLLERVTSWLSNLTKWIPPRAMMLSLILLTIFMRLPGLDSRALWYDEAFSILFAREGPSAMLYGTLTPIEGAAADVHPLLYYGVLWLWMKVFGQSVLAARSLSVVISIAVLITVVALGRVMFSSSVGLLSGLLYALAPFQIHYGQEARMYVLMTFFLLMGTLSLYQAVKEGSRRSMVVFAASAALAMYCHILAFFYLVPLALLFLVVYRNRAALVYIIQGSGLAIVLYMPWLIRLPGQISKVQQAYWIQRPGLSAFAQTIMAFVVDLPVSKTLLPFLFFISILVLVFVCLEYVRLVKHGQEGSGLGGLILGLAWLPVVFLFSVSQFRPLYIVRGLLASAVIYLVAIAWVLHRGRKLSRTTIILCMAIGIVVGVLTHYSYAGFPYAPFTELNDHIRAELNAETIVLHSNKLTMLPAYLDDPELPHRYLQDPPGSGGDTLAYPTQEVLGLFASSDPLVAVEQASRVYFVIFQQEFEDYSHLGYAVHPALASLNKQFDTSSKIALGDLWLYTMDRQR